MSKKLSGGIILTLAFLYCTTETIYFGSNFWPYSPPEVLADGIAAILLAIGIQTLAQK